VHIIDSISSRNNLFDENQKEALEFEKILQSADSMTFQNPKFNHFQ
jgi:hypothetical protein